MIPFLWRTRPKRRGVIYTAIAGGKDDLFDPLHTIPGVDYVCFTDDPRLTSKVWRIAPFEWQHADPVRVAKHVRLFPHVYFPRHEWSLWIDANVHVVGDLTALIDRHLKQGPFHAFRHEERDCVYDEAAICMVRRKDDPNIIEAQIERYRTEGMPTHTGMSTNHVLLRRHHDPAVRKTMERWWAEIASGSRRDQISLPYILWKNPVDFRFFLKGALWTDFPPIKRVSHRRAGPRPPPKKP